MSQKKKGKYITTAKERAFCLQGEGTTENAAIQMLHVFLLFIKGQKKNCYKMFFNKWNFVCYRKNEKLFVPLKII